MGLFGTTAQFVTRQRSPGPRERAFSFDRRLRVGGKVVVDEAAVPFVRSRQFAASQRRRNSWTAGAKPRRPLSLSDSEIGIDCWTRVIDDLREEHRPM